MIILFNTLYENIQTQKKIIKTLKEQLWISKNKQNTYTWKEPNIIWHTTPNLFKLWQNKQYELKTLLN